MRVAATIRHYLGKLGRLLDSRLFLYVILGIFVLQAMWVAWSFNYPMIYDEEYHFSIINIYTESLSPILLDQPPEHDYLRDLRNETSFLYHYLMSFPLRIVELISSNQYVQAISLRFINIAMFAVGLFGYYRLFKTVNIPARYINIGILLFTTLPLVSLLAATTNYDNLAFAITPFFLLALVRIITDTKISAQNLLLFMTLGLFASLVKYTFLPIFAAAIAIVVGYLVYVHRISIFKKLKDVFFGKQKGGGLIILAILCGILLTLFSAIYLKNVVIYGTPSPSCKQTLGVERCMKSGIVARNEAALSTKNQRIPERLPDYVTTWFVNIWRSSVMTGSATPTGVKYSSPPSLYYISQFATIFIAIGGIIYIAGKGLLTSYGRWALIAISVVVIAAVLIFNISSYYRMNIAYANQARYLLAALPIITVFGVYALAVLLRRSIVVKSGVIVAAFVVLTVGGGLYLNVVKSEADWYRSDNSVSAINKRLKDITDRIVIFNSGN